MLRAWMLESVRPASQHAERPGHWVGEPAWPPTQSRELCLYLNEAGLERQAGEVATRNVSSPESTGEQAGSWCPFGIGPDDAGDQRDDDARSLVFETAPLSERFELLGAPMLSLELACDRPYATLVARLCDVHPDGASLRVTYGILDLRYRDGDDTAVPLQPGQRYTVHLRLNDIAFAFPKGHRIRVALSTAYWPIVWPSPERAEVTVFTGTSSLTLPARAPRGEDSLLAPLQVVLPKDPGGTTTVASGRSWREIGRMTEAREAYHRTVREPSMYRIDRIGAELGSAAVTEFKIKDGDPLSAHAFARRTQTFRRADWAVSVELETTLQAEPDAFTLRAHLQAFEGDRAVYERKWHDRPARHLAKGN
jgi:hypothetical protein